MNVIDTTKFVSRTKYENIGSDLEKKISDVDKKYLVLVAWLKETDFNAKIIEVEDKISIITGLATNSTLTTVANKIPDISSLVKNTDYDAKLKTISDRVASNKTKHLLVENELKKLKTFDPSFFKGNTFGNLRV